MEGHAALVHTAAASNLGQMLVRLCKAEANPAGQYRAERGAGTAAQGDGCRPCLQQRQSDVPRRSPCRDRRHRCDASFRCDRRRHARQRHPVGDGALTVGHGAQSSAAMDQQCTSRSMSMAASTCARLSLDRSFGLAWGVGGWLLTPFLEKIGTARANELQAKVAAEITTTFASNYCHRNFAAPTCWIRIVVRAFSSGRPGEKFLLNPSLPLV